ncbi:MAG TPA: hypothetical protein VMZ49_02780 [Patescibacteria group bacterium]|nr:hypothetical protein [Patescibacteria group bacterium]
MNKIDTTRFLRQMKYLPDIIPLANILLIVALIVFPGAIMNWSFLPVLEEQTEIKYANYEPSGYSSTSVTIKKTGEIYIIDREIEDLSKMKGLLADRMDEFQSKRLRIFAESEAPWGKIIDVLQAAKEAGAKMVGFMMAREYSVLHYWEMKKFYREKGLKEPSVSQITH